MHDFGQRPGEEPLVPSAEGRLSIDQGIPAQGGNLRMHDGDGALLRDPEVRGQPAHEPRRLVPCKGALWIPQRVLHCHSQHGVASRLCRRSDREAPAAVARLPQVRQAAKRVILPKFHLFVLKLLHESIRLLLQLHLPILPDVLDRLGRRKPDGCHLLRGHGPERILLAVLIRSRQVSRHGPLLLRLVLSR